MDSMAQEAYKDGRRRARTFHDPLHEVSGRPRPEGSPQALFGSKGFSPSLVWLRDDEHIVFTKRQHGIEAGAVYKGSNGTCRMRNPQSKTLISTD